MLHRLDALRERLLHAGIAPRHAHRFVRELAEHYEDALAEELPRHATRGDAEQRAWARLGAQDDLVSSVLAKPELRSIAARFPRLVFGALPVSAWLGSLVVSLVVVRVAASGLQIDDRTSAESALSAAHAACLLGVRVLPVLIGVLTMAGAVRQRSAAHWPLMGAALVAMLSGTISVNLIAASGAAPGQLGLSSSLLPFMLPYTRVLGPMDVAALSFGLLRAATMMLFVVSAYAALRHRVARAKR